MDDDPDDDARWIAVAAYLEPMEPPPPPPRRRCPDARHALVWGILGVVCFGFLFGPLALSLGHRARLRRLADPDLGDAGAVRAAITLGKVGLALHLALALTALPWLLFALPLVGSFGGF